MKRTPLKRKTPLIARKRIKPISKKQVKKNQEYARTRSEITINVCEECGKPPDWRGFSHHHINGRIGKDANNRTNIQRLCAKCHSKKHGVIERET